MKPPQQVNSSALQSWFALGVIAAMRAVFRIMEAVGPEKRRPKLRELREKLEAIERDKRRMIERINDDPAAGSELIDELISRHGDPETQQRFTQARAKAQQLRHESDELKAIHQEAGENTAMAIEGYEQYLQTHPDSQLAYMYLGGAFERLHDWEASLKAYHEASRLAGNEWASGFAVCLQIGMVLHHKGDLEAAANQYRQIVATAPRNQQSVVSIAYLYLGNALNDLGNRNDARSAWKKAASRGRVKIVGENAREMLKANP